MKTLTKFIAMLFLLSLNTNLYSQSGEDMKAWMDYMTPGPVHEMLAKSDGEWNEEITFWMDPSSPPMTTTGTVTNKMILGGRYQQSTYTGDMMGMPFEGISTVGYDNMKKVLVSTWIDNMGTGIMYLEGPWDTESNSCTMTGKMTDPSAGKEVDVKQVFKIIDDNNQIMEMYDYKTGKETKNMEIKFTRK